MKKVLTAVLMTCLCGITAVLAEMNVTVSNLELKGEIEEENITFMLTMQVNAREKNIILPLVIGNVAYLDGKLPKRSELVREGDKYSLKLGSSGKQSITFNFASKPIKDGDWRRTSFSIPAASVRKLSVICDRDDLEVQFPGALNVKREKNKEKTVVTAFLGITDEFTVVWKPQIKKLDSELVVTCGANTIATASVGALRLDTIFTYTIIQGSLNKLVLTLPDVNVTQVHGNDIQDWRIDRTDTKHPKLIVSLSRLKEGIYPLQVTSEMVLAKFPCEFVLPVMTPVGVLRTSGFLMIGADSAIKLQINKSAGLTQVDQASFPVIACQPEGYAPVHRPRPTRSTYAYQYANMPYTLDLKADDIVTSLVADNRLVLSFADNELSFDASLEIDIKDAPAREILIETDPDEDWTVTSVTGRHVFEADMDVRHENNKRVIYVPFKQAVEGVALINIRMEKSLKPNTTSFSSPKFAVLKAKSERGYLVIAAEKGVRLKNAKISGLREVHTGSAPVRVADAQQAFRFKESGWSITVDIERTTSSIHSEVFHLVSLGEGVSYCSAAITYHIGGAPIQEFQVRVPETIESVEFMGADIEGWTRDGETCTVRLQVKIMGDYTLLVTYDKQFDPDMADIPVGVVETVGTESEVGYIAMASAASLKLAEAKPLPDSIIEIDRDEIPAAYSAPITDPIIRSYKYVRNPHTALIRVEPYKTEQLLGQIADYVTLSTMISKDGESETTVTYYIKNASRQHLVVLLPDEVKLWSIKHIDENGNKEDVLSQESAQGILIPVARPRDPNRPTRIELIYAQNHGKLGFWRSCLGRFKFVAPLLSETHSTFASWAIIVPANFAVADVKGNMSSISMPSASGLLGVVRKTWRLLLAVCDGPGRFTLERALNYDFGGPRELEFTRPVGLAGCAPLTLKLRLVPAWMGSAGVPIMMVFWLVAGLFLTAAAVARQKGPALTALGVTVVLIGLAQGSVGRSILAVPLAIIVIVVVVRVLIKIVPRLVKYLSSRLHRRNIETEIEPPPLDDDLMPFEPDELEKQTGEQENGRIGEKEGSDGYVSLRMLCWMCVVGLLTGAVMAKSPAQEPSQPAVPVMESLLVSIQGPGTGKDIEQSAEITGILQFTAKEPCSFVVVPSISVLTSFDLGSRNLEITSRKEGYVLNVRRKGRYEVTLHAQTPVKEEAGEWTLAIYMLESMKNSVTMTLPEPGLDITAEEAVLFKTTETETETRAEAVLGPARVAHFVWRPKARETKLEDAVFFCEVNTLAALQPGVVDLVSLVRYQIAQGEIKDLAVRVPENMSVTAVNAPGLATWSFDPDARLLEAILKKPINGSFTLTVATQVACDGLPYDAVIGVLRVLDTSRQRGSLALAASATVQVSVEQINGLNPMNIEDFSPAAVSAATKEGGRSSAGITIRRAFRYHQAEKVSVTVHTEQVLPEIRVAETGTVSIGDERIVLSTKLELTIAKSGIFSAKLDIPADFDVETLTGRDVSHWDEIKEDGHGVVVHFTRQVTDLTDINLVVARMEKGIEERITVPRVKMEDARKHTGRLTISGERGIRMMVESHRGVDIRKASEEGIGQAGVLVFNILRPTWSIVLKTEVMAPLVKPEVLQWVDITEGMLQCRAYLRYKIENAGIKTFRIKSPMPGITLSVSGRNIARVHQVDEQKGIWQVDLHNKVENQFGMTASYQVPYHPAKRGVKILPLRTVDTEEQRGYLVVTCSGRVQVAPAGELIGLKPEDPRNIPAVFGAGDLSNAIRCYRTVRSEYKLALSVVRHDSAQVLPASINRVHMTSTLSTDDSILTRVALLMTVEDLRFLKVSLPNPDDSLWTVLVNGKEVAASRDGDLYCIPLEEQDGQRATSVDLVYAGSSSSGFFARKQKYMAPEFGYGDKLLPLKDIKWTFYGLPGVRYYGFGGGMEYRDPSDWSIRAFDATLYQEYNIKQREASIQKARQVMDTGEKLAKAGKQRLAKMAYQQALNYSQSEETLNEDARVQLHNLMKQQVKVGLVNRRNVLRVSKNVISEQEPSQVAGFNAGEYTQEYANDVERGLSARDNQALEIVANKIIDQQVAAAGVVTAIGITMPEYGRQLPFFRDRQIDPAKDKLDVTFKTGGNRLWGMWSAMWPAALLFFILWRMLGPRQSVGLMKVNSCVPHPKTGV